MDGLSLKPRFSGYRLGKSRHFCSHLLTVMEMEEPKMTLKLTEKEADILFEAVCCLYENRYCNLDPNAQSRYWKEAMRRAEVLAKLGTRIEKLTRTGVDA